MRSVFYGKPRVLRAGADDDRYIGLHETPDTLLSLGVGQ
jgi:hypothetical protein